MKWKTTVFLLFVALALAVYLYFFEGKSLTTDETEARKGRVYDFKEEDIVYLRMTTGGQEIVLQKTGDTWKMTAPVKAAADRNSVAGVLEGIVGLSTSRIIRPREREKIDWGAYGLSEPEIRIHFSRAGEGKGEGFYLGKQSAFGDQLYARPEGQEALWVLSGFDESIFRKTAEDLRDKKVLNFKTGNVRSVELTYPDKGIRCEKNEQGEWWLKAPAVHRCDNWSVEQYISALEALKTQKFEPYAPEESDKYGFDDPALVVRLNIKGRENPSVLTFGKEESDGEGVYALTSRRRGLQFIESPTAKDLFKSAFDFRLKEVLNFFLDDLESLEIEEGDTVFRFRAEDGAWKLITPFQTEVSGEQMSELTAKFSYLEMRGVPEKQPTLEQAGLAPPRMKISVTLKDKEKRSVILIGEKIETEGAPLKQYGMIGGGDEIFYLDAYIYEGVSDFLKDLKQKPSE